MNNTYKQRIFLALHGECCQPPDAEKQRLMSHAVLSPSALPSALTLRGAVQSRQLGAFLNTQGILSIFCNKELRALQTAYLAKEQARAATVNFLCVLHGTPEAAAVVEEVENFINENGVEVNTEKRQFSNKLVHPKADCSESTGCSISAEANIFYQQQKQNSSSEIKIEGFSSQNSRPFTSLLSKKYAEEGLGCIQLFRFLVTNIKQSQLVKILASFFRSKDAPLNEIEAKEVMYSILAKHTHGALAVVCSSKLELRNFLCAFMPFAHKKKQIELLNRDLAQYPWNSIVPGSVTEIILARDSDRIFHLTADVKELGRADFFSTAALRLRNAYREECGESTSNIYPHSRDKTRLCRAPTKILQKSTEFQQYLQTHEAEEALLRDFRAVAGPKASISLEEAVALSHIYGATPSVKDTHKWAMTEGKSLSFLQMKAFVERHNFTDEIEDLASPFLDYDPMKTGLISRFTFTSLMIGVTGDEDMEAKLKTLFKVFGLAFEDDINYLEFLARVSSVMPVLHEDIATWGEIAEDTAQHILSRAVSLRQSSSRGFDNKCLSFELESNNTEDVSAIVVPVNNETGQVDPKLVENYLKEEGIAAHKQDVQAFLNGNPIACIGFTEFHGKQLQRFVKKRRDRFYASSGGEETILTGMSANLFSDLGFSYIPTEIDVKHFQALIGGPQLSYTEVLAFGEFVESRRKMFEKLAERSRHYGKLHIKDVFKIVYFWGICPSSEDLNKCLANTSDEYITYEQLARLIDDIPYHNDEDENLGQFFCQFDAKARGTISKITLQTLLQYFGDVLSEAEAELFSKHFSVSDTVNYRELVSTVLSK